MSVCVVRVFMLCVERGGVERGVHAVCATRVECACMWRVFCVYVVCVGWDVVRAECG